MTRTPINFLIDQACGYTPEMAEAARLAKKQREDRITAVALEVLNAAVAWSKDGRNKGRVRLKKAVQAMLELEREMATQKGSA